MNLSVLARIDPSQIACDPYPYVHIEDALDPDLYAELASGFPSMNRIVGDRPPGSNKLFQISAFQVIEDETVPRLWRDFVAYHCSPDFLRDTLRFWGEAIAREYPDPAARFGRPLAELRSGLRMPGKKKPPHNRAADVMLDVQFAVNTPVTTPSSVRGPHIDNHWKLFAGLLYFRLPEDQSTGGDLTLYRYASRRHYHDKLMNVSHRFVVPFKTVRYRPNTLVMWLNTGHSLHGVTPRSPTPTPRRYVNLLGECYNLTTGGFFPLRRSMLGRAGTAVRRLVGARDA
jgi:hypothetical protein